MYHSFYIENGIHELLFLYIGFTALCEKYCSGARSKSDGTDQLTSTLNSYLSQIVQGNSKLHAASYNVTGTNIDQCCYSIEFECQLYSIYHGRAYK